MVYGALQRWSPDRFRATLQGFFLPATALICGGHALTGLWTIQVFQLFGLALPLVLLGTLAGARLNRGLPADRFQRVLHLALIGLGLLLVV